MAMQESPKSLRTYFVIAGLWAGYAHLNQLTVPMQLVVRVFNYIGLATAVGFLVIGSQLPKWLTTKTEAIGLFLLANVGVAVAASLWDLNAGAASLGTAISLG